jgi:hypothetical protein
VSLSDKPLQLIPSAWVRAATQRYRDIEMEARAKGTGDPTHNRTLSAIGVDVARGGMDATVVVRRYGAYVAAPLLVPGSEATTGPEVAAKVLNHRRHGCPIVVDANGVGASVYDHLTQALNLDNVVAYVGSRKSLRKDLSNKLGFGNMRSERYWMLRQALDPASPTKLALPDDSELVEELLSMTWEERNSTIHVISKKDLIKILGRSPDKADALVLSLVNSDSEDVEDLRLPSMQSQRVLTRAPRRDEDFEYTPRSSIDRPKPYQVRGGRQRRVRW